MRGAARVEVGAELLQMLAVGVDDLAAVLHDDEAGHDELAALADVDQPAKSREPVAWCVDRLVRLAVVLRVMLAFGEVRQVRDDDVHGARDRREQVALEDVDAVGDAVPGRVLARERDRVGTHVGRVHLDLGRCDRDRDADHARAGPDVRYANRAAVDELERSVHECLRRGAGGEDASGRGEELEAVEGCLHKNAAVADWAAHYRREDERYTDGESRLPATEDSDARQRQLTRMGNAAAGAGLALLMQGRGGEAREWFDRACDRYRESWQHAPPGSWGRPIGVLKARVLAGDWEGAEGDARWALDEGAAGADSPIGRYAAALAFAVLGEWTDLRAAADDLRMNDDFPADVADALAAIASPDPIAYVEAVESVLESFETREAYLEDLPAADTVLVLQALAGRRGLAPAPLESELLPP